MCLDSDIYDLWRSCGDCNITYIEPECQLSCEYCLAGEGTDTASVPAPRADQVLDIPAVGCSVDRRDFQLKCRPLSEGNCGELACKHFSNNVFPAVTCSTCLLQRHHTSYVTFCYAALYFWPCILSQCTCHLAGPQCMCRNSLTLSPAHYCP